jgi:hypothetical protein
MVNARLAPGLHRPGRICTRRGGWCASTRRCCRQRFKRHSRPSSAEFTWEPSGALLQGSTIKEILAELFFQKGKKWNPLAASLSRKVKEVYLNGELWHSMPFDPGPAGDTDPTDNFTRADANPIGGNWTTSTGLTALKIVSNQLASAGSNVDSAAWWNAATFSSDHYSEATYAAGVTDFGPAVRMQSAAGTFYWADTSTPSFFKMVNAGATQIAGVTATIAANDIIRMEAEGSVLRWKKNGASVTGSPISDSSIPSGGAPGVFIFAATARVSLWTGADLTAPTLPSPLSFTRRLPGPFSRRGGPPRMSRFHRMMWGSNDPVATTSPIGNTRQLLWNTSTNIGNTRQLLWNISTKIGNTRQLLWNVSTVVGNNRQLLWNVNATVGNTRQLLWSLNAVVGNTRQLLWNVSANVGNSRQLLWNVSGAVGNSRQLLWNVQKIVSLNRQLLWNVSGAVGNSRQLLWDVTAAVGNSRQLLWNVSQVVGNTRQLLWNVIDLTAVGNSRQLLWNVDAHLAVTRRLLWAVDPNPLEERIRELEAELAARGAIVLPNVSDPLVVASTHPNFRPLSDPLVVASQNLNFVNLPLRNG